ncbi:hypothetical protein BC828DRAFT_437714 [Blastocladiella britannica]|nr:hypothetical protein BC828DRAFT_437714 [Blastocladiella britannica]
MNSPQQQPTTLAFVPLPREEPPLYRHSIGTDEEFEQPVFYALDDGNATESPAPAYEEATTTTTTVHGTHGDAWYSDDDNDESSPAAGDPFYSGRPQQSSMMMNSMAMVEVSGTANTAAAANPSVGNTGFHFLHDHDHLSYHHPSTDTGDIHSAIAHSAQMDALAAQQHQHFASSGSAAFHHAVIVDPFSIMVDPSVGLTDAFGAPVAADHSHAIGIDHSSGFDFSGFVVDHSSGGFF